jgi:hypothetical protein
MLTLSSGVQAGVSDKSLLDRLEGTVVWELQPDGLPSHDNAAYKGLMKMYTNQTMQRHGGQHSGGGTYR